MRWSAALLAFCACNQVFDLRETRLPPPDAAPTCPPLGAPLAFSTVAVEVVHAPCIGYTLSASANLAVAACRNMDGTYTIEQGSLDATELTDAGLVPSIAGAQFDQVALSPDGDQLFVRQVYNAAGLFLRYRQGASGWGAAEAAFAMAQLSTNDSIGVPSVDAGDGRRIAVASGGSLLELVEDGQGMWHWLRETLYTDLGVTYAAHPNLSADGLRVVFFGTSTLGASALYAERATRDDTFGPAHVIGGIPSPAQTPFMLADCGRLYYSTTNAVVYAPQ